MWAQAQRVLYSRHYSIRQPCSTGLSNGSFYPHNFSDATAQNFAMNSEQRRVCLLYVNHLEGIHADEILECSTVSARKCVWNAADSMIHSAAFNNSLCLYTLALIYLLVSFCYLLQVLPFFIEEGTGKKLTKGSIFVSYHIIFLFVSLRL